MKVKAIQCFPLLIFVASFLGLVVVVGARLVGVVIVLVVGWWWIVHLNRYGDALKNYVIVMQ